MKTDQSSLIEDDDDDSISELQHVRKLSIVSINYSFEIVSSHKDDNFDVLKQYAIDTLKAVKGIDHSNPQDY